MFLYGSPCIPNSLQAIHADNKDPTQFSLVYANRSEADIIMRKELEEWASHDKRFRLCLCLSHPAEGWQASTCHVNEGMLRYSLFTIT